MVVLELFSGIEMCGRRRKYRTALKLEKYHGEPEDKCRATLRFTDSNTRERLVVKFKFWLWHKPPQHITQDINERATRPLSKAKSAMVVSRTS